MTFAHSSKAQTLKTTRLNQFKKTTTLWTSASACQLLHDSHIHISFFSQFLSVSQTQGQKGSEKKTKLNIILCYKKNSKL